LNEKVISLYNRITNCTDWYTIKKCKNANGQKPLAMTIPRECRIMVVSQAPSRNASDRQILANENNQTFNQFMNVMDIKQAQFLT